RCDAGYGEASAKFLRLDHGALGEFYAGDAHGETEIVLDPGGCAGLTPRGGHLDAQRVQPFRRAVHSRGQAGWPSPHDDEVEAGSRHLGLSQSQATHGESVSVPGTPGPAEIRERIAIRSP